MLDKGLSVPGQLPSSSESSHIPGHLLDSFRSVSVSPANTYHCLQTTDAETQTILGIFGIIGGYIGQQGHRRNSQDMTERMLALLSPRHWFLLLFVVERVVHAWVLAGSNV